MTRMKIATVAISALALMLAVPSSAQFLQQVDHNQTIAADTTVAGELIRGCAIDGDGAGVANVFGCTLANELWTGAVLSGPTSITAVLSEGSSLAGPVIFPVSYIIDQLDPCPNGNYVNWWSTSLLGVGCGPGPRGNGVNNNQVFLVDGGAAIPDTPTTCVMTYEWQDGFSQDFGNMNANPAGTVGAGDWRAPVWYLTPPAPVQEIYFDTALTVSSGGCDLGSYFVAAAGACIGDGNNNLGTPVSACSLFLDAAATDGTQIAGATGNGADLLLNYNTVTGTSTGGTIRDNAIYFFTN